MGSPGFLPPAIRKVAQRRTPDMSTPASPSPDLRALILSTTPDQVGVSPSDALPNVWGVLMEMWLEKTLVTLVSLADGTTSLYFSTGGGIIGAGGHAEVASASNAFIRQAEDLHRSLPEVDACSMPAVGNIAFHLLTFAAHRSIEVPDAEARGTDGVWYPLWVAGQRVLKQIRLHSPPPDSSA
jgi:hypothetical protein